MELTKEQTEEIRKGFVKQGFSQYDANMLSIQSYKSMSGGVVVTLGMRLSTTWALDNETLEVPGIFFITGRSLAHLFQEKMAENLPCIRIGDKVIMSVEEYNGLRLQQMSNLSFTSYDKPMEEGK